MMNRLERQKTSRLMHPIAVNRMHSASRLGKYRLDNSEQPEAYTKKLLIRTRHPILIFSCRCTYSNKRAFPSIPFLYGAFGTSL